MNNDVMLAYKAPAYNMKALQLHLIIQPIQKL